MAYQIYIFFKKKKRTTGISYQHTHQTAFGIQHLKPSLVLKSRTNNHLKIDEFNTSLIDKFIAIRTMLLTILGRGGGKAWKCDFDLRPSNFCGETGGDSAAGLESSSVNYENFSLASGTYHIKRVLTHAATAPTPIPIPRMRFNRQETIREQKKSTLIGAKFQDPRLSRVRPELMSFRGRLGVALCANKESVCECVCRDRI